MKKILLSLLLCSVAHAGLWVDKNYQPSKKLENVCDLLGIKFDKDLHTMKERFDPYHIKDWNFLAEQPLKDSNEKQIYSETVKNFLELYDGFVKPMTVDKNKIDKNTVIFITSGERDKKTNEILAKLLGKFEDKLDTVASIVVFLKYKDSEEIMREALEKQFSKYMKKIHYIVASDTKNVTESCAQALNEAWYKMKDINYITIAQKPNFGTSVGKYFRIGKCIGHEMQPITWKEGVELFYKYDEKNNRKYPYPNEALAKVYLHNIGGELFNAVEKLDKIDKKKELTRLYVSFLSESEGLKNSDSSGDSNNSELDN